MSAHYASMRSSHPFLLIAGALLGLTGVALGAFGAHGLKATFDVTGGLENWKTAVFYQLIHAVALLALANHPGSIALRTGRWWTLGVILFSGSLYLLALGAPVRFLWPVTPAGGLALLLGWATLSWSALRQSKP